MNIEVTNATFYTIFDSTHFTNTKRSELANTHYYFNSEKSQRGQIIHNFISNTKQYYFTDINA